MYTRDLTSKRLNGPGQIFFLESAPTFQASKSTSSQPWVAAIEEYQLTALPRNPRVPNPDLWTDFPAWPPVCLITTNPTGSLSCCLSLSVSSGLPCLLDLSPQLVTLSHSAAPAAPRHCASVINLLLKNRFWFFSIIVLKFCDMHIKLFHCTRSRWLH